MKRKWLLSILLCLSFCLCGCALREGESQFTQIDSRYLSSEEESETNLAVVEEQQGEKLLQDTDVESVADEDKKTQQSNSKFSDKKETSDKEKAAKKDKEKNPDETQKAVKDEADRNVNATAKEKREAKKDSSKKSKETSTKVQKEVKENTEAAKSPEPDKTPQENRAFCTISIDCLIILEKMSELNPDKKDFVPENGWILKDTKVFFEEGDTAYEVLYQVCREQKIHMEAAYTPAYGTYYVEGIHQLYEFDCGDLSGWTFLVNGKSTNYGSSQYEVKNGDVIQWRFSCNAGRDVR